MYSLVVFSAENDGVMQRQNLQIPNILTLQNTIELNRKHYNA